MALGNREDNKQQLNQLKLTMEQIHHVSEMDKHFSSTLYETAEEKTQLSTVKNSTNIIKM